MAWPGYPDSFDAGWWREVVTTPPVFTGTGALTNSNSVVSSFSATYQMMTLTPLAGQQVTGAGIPTNTYVAASPAPTNSSFTMTQAATNAGTVPITIGAEPVTLAEAKQWARVEFNDDDSLIQDIITAARNWIEGAELKRSLMLQGRTYYGMGFPWTGGYYNRLIRSMGPNPWWLPTAQGIILLPYPNMQQLLSVQYIDPSSGNLDTIPLSNVLWTQNSVPARIQPQYGTVWPLPRPVIDSVQIAWATGYGPNASDIPTCVRLAMRAFIAANYENREGFMDGQLTISPMMERLLDPERWGSYP